MHKSTFKWKNDKNENYFATTAQSVIEIFKNLLFNNLWFDNRTKFKISCSKFLHAHLMNPMILEQIRFSDWFLNVMLV